MVTVDDDLRAEALFCSPLQPSTRPSDAEVRAAVDAHPDVAACASDVAQEFGDHPETAVRRMAWCRAAVEAAFSRVSV